MSNYRVTLVSPSWLRGIIGSVSLWSLDNRHHIQMQRASLSESLVYTLAHYIPKNCHCHSLMLSVCTSFVIHYSYPLYLSLGDYIHEIMHRGFACGSNEVHLLFNKSSNVVSYVLGRYTSNSPFCWIIFLRPRCCSPKQ